MYNKLQRMNRLSVLTGVALLTACSTPQHTNTLIFGTSTRMALDVSQEPTGALGITLGYKRHEAVWLPLLANQAAASGSGLQPASCSGNECPRFVGKAGSATSNGPGAEDTYSVLATFSGDMGGGANVAPAASAASVPTGNVNAQAKIKQYFATGLAARLLAEQAGAAAVSEGAATPPAAAPKISEEALKAVATQCDRASVIAIKVSKTDDSINAGALGKLLEADPAKGLHDSVKSNLKSFKNRVALQAHLCDGPGNVVSKLWQSLDAPGQ